MLKTDSAWSRSEVFALTIIGLAASIGLYCGWGVFWFLTDDAFIAFRYVSNSMLGYGYVWNAPPFLPVEGYTSFLWVLLLDLVWRLFGIEPPESANWLALGFSFLTILISSRMIISMRWSDALKKYRILFLALILLGTLTNRTFLAWTSSGLETSLFNCAVTLWCYSNLFVTKTSKRWFFAVSISALLIYLTRPDGMLFAVVSVIILSWGFWLRGRKLHLGDVYSAFPLLGIPLHLLWRHSFYGEWLPNTYYAKVIAGRIWWESGYRYLLSFVIEYSLWLWIAIVLVWIVSVFRVNGRALLHYHRIVLDDLIVQFLVVVGLFAHFLYYTVVVGGDHFEYRVYSHLIPLLFISFVWFLNRINARFPIALAIMSAFIVFSWPIPWANWRMTHNLNERSDTRQLAVLVAPYLHGNIPVMPGVFYRYLSYYDSLQFWLIDRGVGIRFQQHKIFALFLLDYFPSREEGALIKNDEFPVAKQDAVGVLSWVLPHVNIIDLLGLNDYVIARNPNLRTKERMAHGRKAPPGYVECFDTNVITRRKLVSIAKRDEPLTADDIRRCEAFYREWIKYRTP